MFTEDDLRTLAANASTLHERLTGPFVPIHPGDDDAGKARLEEWCRVAAHGDAELFRRRLACDGIEEDAARKLLAGARLASDASMPPWVPTFAWASRHFESTSAAAQDPALDPNHPLPFEDLFLPVVEAARRRWDDVAGESAAVLAPGARAALDRALLQQITSLAGPPLLDKFFIFKALTPWSSLDPAVTARLGGKARYAAFVDELRRQGLRDLFMEKPVLARLLSTILESWLTVSSEMIVRLACDLEILARTFSPGCDLGPVVGIDYAVSDRHEGGRAVSVVRFASDVLVVYKPKELGVQHAWHEFVDWVNENGASLPLVAPRILRREGYGWVEFMEHLPCADQEDTRHYYRRAGMVLCLVYLLEGTDCHVGNVIAHGPQPIPIDLETILHPVRVDDLVVQGHPAVAAATAPLLASVLATSFLPTWVEGIDDNVIELGGIGVAHTSVARCLRFVNVNIDSMRLDAFVDELVHVKHLPYVGGVPVPSDGYGQDIAAGFEVMYRLLLDERAALLAVDGPLALLRAQQVRVVFRPTQLYGLLLQQSKERRYLRDGVDWSMRFEFLCRYFEWGHENDRMWPLFSAELASLVQLDIPFFTTRSDSDTLSLPTGDVVAGCFQSTSYLRLLDRIENMNEKILEEQLALIRFSVDPPRVPELHRSVTSASAAPLDPSTAVDAALEIAAQLRAVAVRAGDGAAWLGAVPLPGEERFRFDEIGHGLYSGSGGVALFLAALERVTGGAGYKDLALAALAPLRGALHGNQNAGRTRELGVAQGHGSIIYTLSQCAELLGEAALSSDARLAALAVSDAQIAACRSVGMMTGLAGALMGLLTLLRATSDAAVLDRVGSCARNLASIVLDERFRERAAIGVAHGSAGVGYALARAFEVTKDERLLDASRKVVQIERALLNNVRAASARPDPVAGRWCRGIVGIGLLRAQGGALLAGDTGDEVEAALHAALTMPITQVDSLCCGNFGRVEALHTLALEAEREDLRVRALCLASEVLALSRKSGGFGWIAGDDAQNPGLFCGLSGVGYALLRLARPNTLPCILRCA